MINYIGRKFTNNLINRKIIQEETADIYLYGTYIIVSTSLGMISILIFSAIISKMIYGIAFLMFYIPLRIRTGGYHAHNYFGCYLISNISFVLLLMFHMQFGRLGFFDELLCACSVFCIIYIYLSAPIIHKNNPLPIKKQNLNVKKMHVILTAYFMVILLYSMLDIRAVIIEICGLAIILVTFFVWIEKIKRRGENRHELLFNISIKDH